LVLTTDKVTQCNATYLVLLVGDFSTGVNSFTYDLGNHPT